MSLHVDSYSGVGGSGAPLLLIHGWGMHGGMWGGVAEKLSKHFNVLAVDLPGHGYSAGKGEGGREKGEEPVLPFPLIPSPFFLDAIVDELSAQFREPLTLCGWSLGGQVALRWAMRCPQQVSRLILVASTP
ncbi:MAG: alpha/beta fold hydrolase, partial [Gallionella sp.]